MGRKDTVTKDYTEDCHIFADAFNQYIYKGEQVIKPEKLHPLDTTEIGVPYGADGAGVPVQKYRDGLKCLTAMEDDNAVYLLLGLENQAEIHYAMPVRDMVYDALQYAAQVEKVAKAHREDTRGKKARQMSVTKGQNRPSSAEYLSGFYKEDCLVPVVTLVLYFGSEEWNGPMTLHEMFSVQDPVVLSFVSDYRVNLLAPASLSDEELDRFATSLREVMLFIKYAKDKNRLNDMLQNDKRFRNVERKAATVISTVTGSEFEMKEDEETVDMCEGIRGIIEDASKEGLQQGMQQGMQQGERRLLIKILADLGVVSEELQSRIQEIDEVTLKQWVKLAARAESMEEFISII